jgi:hypothetical protein
MTFDLTNWQCVSQCTTPDIPLCLYESDGDAYLHCLDGCMYHISSLHPLTISTSPHGHVTGVKYYNRISHLGPGRLVGVSEHPPAVHVITPDGRQLADLTTCGGYRFTHARGVVCAGRRVVVSGMGEGNCLGQEWNRENRVVCLEESAGSWSVQWMHEVVNRYRCCPVIAPRGGTVILPCLARIVILSLETGAVVQQVEVPEGCPALGYGTCIYGMSLLVGCWEHGVVEFALQESKMQSYSYNICNVQLLCFVCSCDGRICKLYIHSKYCIAHYSQKISAMYAIYAFTDTNFQKKVQENVLKMFTYSLRYQNPQ